MIQETLTGSEADEGVQIIMSQIEKHLKAIHISGQLNLHYVNYILGLGWIDNGAFKLNIKPYCIKQVSVQIESLFMTQCLSKNIELEFVISKNLWFMLVEIDEHRFS